MLLANILSIGSLYCHCLLYVFHFNSVVSLNFTIVNFFVALTLHLLCLFIFLLLLLHCLVAFTLFHLHSHRWTNALTWIEPTTRPTNDKDREKKCKPNQWSTSERNRPICRATETWM